MSLCPCACVHVKINKFVSLQKCSFNLLSDDEHDEANTRQRRSRAQGRPHPQEKHREKEQKQDPLSHPTRKQGHIAVAGKNANSASEKVRPESHPEVAQRKVATEPEKWLNYKLSTPAGHPR